MLALYGALVYRVVMQSNHTGATMNTWIQEWRIWVMRDGRWFDSGSAFETRADAYLFAQAEVAGSYRVIKV